MEAKSQSPLDYWKTVADGLNEVAYRSPHTMNAVRLRIVMDILNEYEPGRLLDAGCGGGYTTRVFRDAGWNAEATDISADMARTADAYLQANGHPARLVAHAPITDLHPFSDNTFDVVVCAGVLYYVENEDCAWRELRRVLKPGGALLVSQQNELFDLFTFNRYTRRFFKRNVYDLLSDDPARTAALDKGLSSLIAHPDSPVAHDNRSARDKIFTKPDNPLTFPKKAESFGFSVASGPHYHGIHILPPLLEEAFPDCAEEAAEKQYSLRHDWRSLFMAAHFLFELRKIG